MDNLNFGWEFSLVLLLVFIFCYYLISAMFFCVTIFFSFYVKKIICMIPIYNKEKNGIIKVALPYFMAAIIVQQLQFVALYTFKNGLNFRNVEVWNIFYQPYSFFQTSYLGTTIYITFLSLSRYSFSRDFTSFKTLDIKKQIKLFFIFTTLLGIVLTFIFENIVIEFLPYDSTIRIIFPLVIGYVGYFLLKTFNVKTITIDSNN